MGGVLGGESDERCKLIARRCKLGCKLEGSIRLGCLGFGVREGNHGVCGYTNLLYIGSFLYHPYESWFFP